MHDEIEFDCVDCGLHVLSMAPPHNPACRCAGCQWLSEMPGVAAEKATVRQVLREIGVTG